MAEWQCWDAAFLHELEGTPWKPLPNRPGRTIPTHTVDTEDEGDNAEERTRVVLDKEALTCECLPLKIQHAGHSVLHRMTSSSMSRQADVEVA